MSEVWKSLARSAVERVHDATTVIRELNPPAPVVRVLSASGISVHNVVTALEQFPECVRYLNTRRSTGAIIDINGESDVQDVVYLMLRPWVIDLVPENPTDRVASRYSIEDFLSREVSLVVEAKYVRDKKHGRDLSKEIHDDIEVYRNHHDCMNLVFFIYDRDALIPDVAALKRQVEGIRTYGTKQMAVFCVVKP